MDRTASHRSFRLIPLALALAACEPRSDGETTPRTPLAEDDASSSSGAGPATHPGGVFTMDSTDVVVEPVGCRIEREGTWTLELGSPPDDGPWTATERFDAYATAYACTGTVEAFTCTTEQGHDYRRHGVDADVSLTVTYEGAFDRADRIEGSFALRFECTGTQCSTVADDWTVAAFPCSNRGRFVGDLR